MGGGHDLCGVHEDHTGPGRSRGTPSRGRDGEVTRAGDGGEVGLTARHGDVTADAWTRSQLTIPFEYVAEEARAALLPSRSSTRASRVKPAGSNG
ncbi:hypothetical protein GCM10017559_38680 [Streptosporangium longisporum]|uniref:Uncharacterized protein n=1 Tax=Streptosporangium longisporum TaxID=46187 RepID=A0ABP6KKG9_9ACTN